MAVTANNGKILMYMFAPRCQPWSMQHHQIESNLEEDHRKQLHATLSLTLLWTSWILQISALVWLIRWCGMRPIQMASVSWATICMHLHHLNETGLGRHWAVLCLAMSTVARTICEHCDNRYKSYKSKTRCRKRPPATEGPRGYSPPLNRSLCTAHPHAWSGCWGRTFHIIGHSQSAHKQYQSRDYRGVDMNLRELVM